MPQRHMTLLEKGQSMGKEETRMARLDIDFPVGPLLSCRRLTALISPQSGAHLKAIVSMVTLGLCLGAAGAFAFDDHDTKSIVALELMGQEELAREAMRACQEMIATQSAPQPDQTNSYRLANQYLRTIGLVLETKNNGQVPQWYTDIVQASLGSDTTACASAALEAGYRKPPQRTERAKGRGSTRITEGRRKKDSE